MLKKKVNCTINSLSSASSYRLRQCSCINCRQARVEERRRYTRKLQEYILELERTIEKLEGRV